MKVARAAANALLALTAGVALIATAAAAQGRGERSPVEFLTGQIEQAGLLAPLVGLLAGGVLTVTPVSWPSLPAVVALVGPARAAAREERAAAVSGPRGFAVVLGFVIGMDGVVATLSAGFVGVLVVLTRAAVVLNVVAVVLLTYAAVRLLRANGPAVCRRLDALPPDPLRAVSAGVLFSVSGCPGCAPVAAAVGAAAAAAGPFASLLVVAAFVVGRAATLYAAAAAGGRWLVPDDPRKARRVDQVLAAVLLLSAAYYAWRLVDGQVVTTLPGEGGVLP